MSEPNGRIGQNGAGPGADEDERIFGFDTLAVHAGQRPDPVTGARAMPIYQTTSYVFEDTDHAAELFALQRFGNIYTRIMNPTTAAFESGAVALEQGAGGLATFVGPGRAVHRAGDATRSGGSDHLVERLYGGTYTQFDVTLRRWASTPSSSILPIRRISAGDAADAGDLRGDDRQPADRCPRHRRGRRDRPRGRCR